MSIQRSLTTRRGFIAGMSLGVLSLYAVWAAYDAVPLPWSADEHAEPDLGTARSGDEHAAHRSAVAGPSVDEFRAQTEEFIARFKREDGSVEPSAPESPVYLMAYRWGYEPAVLRLRANTPYSFRMMAVDVSHGASIRLGRASRMIRLRKGTLVESDLTFTRRGEFLVYCSVYCGAAHARMTGTIIVG